MTEKDVVKKFIDSPLHISDDVVAGYEVMREEFLLHDGYRVKHYRDLVCLLHLLLVKHEEKKGFIFLADDKLDDIIKICRRLELKWEKPERLGLMPVISKSRKMDKKMADVIMKVAEENKRLFEDPTNPMFMQQHGSWIVCSMDSAFLRKTISEQMSIEKFAKVEEYPECCVNAFIERDWDDYEILVSHLDQQEAQGLDLNDNYVKHMAKSINVSTEIAAKASWVIKNVSPNQHCGLIGKNNARLVWSYVQTSEKYPFLIHSACENCLYNENSSSAKMNERFSKFCKNRYPELHDSIVIATKIIASIAPKIKLDLENFHGTRL